MQILHSFYGLYCSFAAILPSKKPAHHKGAALNFETQFKIIFEIAILNGLLSVIFFVIVFSPFCRFCLLILPTILYGFIFI